MSPQNEETDYGKELQHWSKHIEQHPKDYVGWFNKGLAFANLDRKEDAIRCLERAAKLNPTDADIYDLMARCHMGIGDMGWGTFSFLLVLGILGLINSWWRSKDSTMFPEEGEEGYELKDLTIQTVLISIASLGVGIGTYFEENKLFYHYMIMILCATIFIGAAINFFFKRKKLV